MSDADPTNPPRRWERPIKIVAAFLLAYLIVAYVAMPGLWLHYGHRHPKFGDIPGITHTSDGHPGDPLNVALIGSKDDLIAIMLEAKWHPADPITLKSSLEIAAATVLKRDDQDAPVSSLYLYGRKQDLAFEQQVGPDPRHRHHVRFWKSDKIDDAGPLWMGSVTYDKSVGLSHTTGQVTHHIGPDIDAERDHLFDTLEKTGDLIDIIKIADFHKIRSGKNGGGDPWTTDGTLYQGTIRMKTP